MIAQLLELARHQLKYLTFAIFNQEAYPGERIMAKRLNPQIDFNAFQRDWETLEPDLLECAHLVDIITSSMGDDREVFAEIVPGAHIDDQGRWHIINVKVQSNNGTLNLITYFNTRTNDFGILFEMEAGLIVGE